ncbi:MAG: DUF5343 domain-containing protein [Pseudomonadaceae bacterium]|nr:DUF5343 domain-containing protein [Pseudomonadaceae bacterium]
MAENNKQTFPRLPVSSWWKLRENFKRSIPGTVTASYIATVFDTKESSARANVLPFLSKLGIIDEDGKTGDRARRWRDDVEYAELCKEILEDVYPVELREAVPDPDENRAAAERWFANKTGAGETAVRQMAALYTVIAKGDPADAAATQKAVPKKKAKHKLQQKAKQEPKAPELPKTPHVNQPPPPPGININLEVHISSDATPDQIDQIFESMAKHIYQKK